MWKELFGFDIACVVIFWRCWIVATCNSDELTHMTRFWCMVQPGSIQNLLLFQAFKKYQYMCHGIHLFGAVGCPEYDSGTVCTPAPNSVTIKVWGLKVTGPFSNSFPNYGYLMDPLTSHDLELFSHHFHSVFPPFPLGSNTGAVCLESINSLIRDDLHACAVSYHHKTYETAAPYRLGQSWDWCY